MDRVLITIEGGTEGYDAKNGIHRFFKPSDTRELQSWIMRNLKDWKYEIAKVM